MTSKVNPATTELIDAEAATIPNRIAQPVRNVLNVEYVALWQYDSVSGDLEEHAVDATEDVDSHVIEPETDISQRAWETIIGAEIDVENALDGESDVASPVRSPTFVPLGRDFGV